MQLCALETHIRIPRNLKKIVDLMRNHRSGPGPSLCPLQAQASGPKISGNLIVGCKGSARLLPDTLIGLQDYWRKRLASSLIVACRTANPTSFLRCAVGSASILSATAIFWRLAITHTDTTTPNKEADTIEQMVSPHYFRPRKPPQKKTEKCRNQTQARVVNGPDIGGPTTADQ